MPRSPRRLRCDGPGEGAPQTDYRNGAERPSPHKKEQATRPRDTPNGRLAPARISSPQLVRQPYFVIWWIGGLRRLGSEDQHFGSVDWPVGEQREAGARRVWRRWRVSRKVLACGATGDSCASFRWFLWAWRGWWRGHPRYAAVDQNGVAGVAAAPVNSTGSWRVWLMPPRTFWRLAYIGSLSKPLDDGAWPIANTPTTRCWPARNEVEI